jgi:hypothetical protein
MENESRLVSGKTSSGTESTNSNLVVKAIETSVIYRGGEPEGIDSAVNAMALLNALVLTIPYGVMGSLDNGFWDWLKESFDVNCQGKSLSDDTTWGQAHGNILSAISCTTYSAISAMIMGTMFVSYFFSLSNALFFITF